jgi:putative membrane protein
MSPHERRLHRAAIGVYVLNAVREAALPLLILIVISVFRGGLDVGSLANGLLYGTIGIAIAAVAGWWRWNNTRWFVDDFGIHKRTGLLTTKQTDIPFGRIQALDLEQGPVQRLLGVFAVHVQTAGGGQRGEIVLEAIHDDELDALRELVGAPAEPQPLQERRLSMGSLLTAALTAGQLGVILPALAGAAQLSQNVLGDEAERDAINLIPNGAHEWFIAAAALLLAAWLLSVAGAVVAFSGFTVARDRDRLRIRRGLLERRETTIPVDRVRAVVVVEGLLRWPFGLAALRLEVIGHAKEPAAAQTLFPLLRRSEVRAFLDQLLPELADDLDRLAPLPRRALRRYVLPPVVIALIFAAGAWLLVGPWGLVATPVAAAYGVARFRAAGWRFADGRLVVRSLMLARTTVLAPAEARESVTLGQTVFQRRGHLADVAVAFGKRTHARLHHLDATTAHDLFTAVRGAFPSHSDVNAPRA